MGELERAGVLMRFTHGIEQDLAGIEVNDRGEGLVGLGKEIGKEIDWGNGNDVPGESGDATDEVNVRVYEMGGLGKPGRAEEGAIGLLSDDTPDSYITNLDMGDVGTLRAGHLCGEGGKCRRLLEAIWMM